MTKKQFLKKLNNRLRRLKGTERKKYVSDYSEILSDMIENGMTETAAIHKLGDIEKIAREILENAGPESYRKLDLIGIFLLAISILLVLASLAELIIGYIVLGRFTFYSNGASSVSIIGGADGPTSIFLAGSVGVPTALYVACGIVLLLTSTYFFLKHLKKR